VKLRKSVQYAVTDFAKK